ncbi:M56 family metallopeptidase [Enterococcus wangshanyuanii]|uniref:Peptidase M56 domain-containing protein n=1 Tax=Enterococcus wangshanyuanii TaxID=2005703 RepID=A0ABQ1NRX9_9ENTE|nr:M56 family metallopeptidase [Enterococcus wangshanyuanii]GGC83439.1 hypothetical protein GCM10011573_11330 [Enterococcus wangshanyuanii]
MTSLKLLMLLVSLSLSGTILFGIWTLFRRILSRKISHRMYYYLLLIVLLRLILPISPEQSLIGKSFSIIESSTIYTTFFGPKDRKNPAVIVGDNVVIGDNVVMGSKGKNIAPYILYIWLVIGFGFLIQKITKYQSFVKYIKADWHPVDDPLMLDTLSTLCEEKGIYRPVELYTSALISSPLLLGIKKSYIILPRVQLTEVQLYHILAHELTHSKNKDLFYKWFMQLIICIHWFNPAMYFIAKTLNQECEYACDEGTTGHYTKEQQFYYGTTLIEMAKMPNKYNEKVASVTLYENTYEIKKRLDVLLATQKNPHFKRLTSVFSAMILVFSAIVLGAYTVPKKTITTDKPIESSSTNESSVDVDSSKSKPLGRPFS